MEGETPTNETPDLVIRTMRDDVQELRAHTPRPNPVARTTTFSPPSGVPPPPKRFVDGAPKATAVPVSTLPVAPTVNADPAARQFPLPPKDIGRKQKVIIPPAIRKAAHIPRRVLIITITGIAVAGALGAGVWWYLGSQRASPSSPQSLMVGSGQVLPANTLLALRYTIANPEAKAAITAAWQTTGETPSTTNLLSGDPRLLLEKTSVSEFYYVVLGADPRPYLLVPKNKETQALFTDNYDASFGEFGDWYVVHPLSTDVYLRAVADGTLAEQATLAAVPVDQHLSLFLSQTMVHQISEYLAGATFASDSLAGIPLQAQFVPLSGLIRVAGTALTQALLPSGSPVISAPVTEEGLFNYIPQDAEFVRLGSNFQADATAWLTRAGQKIAALDQPAVAQLLSQLNTSYAFYRRGGADASDDFGFVITLPAQLIAGLRTKDPGLEEALRALTPLIVADAPAIPTAFADGTYQNVPIRYVNLAGQLHAIDYTIVDTHLVVATSKEGLFALVETIKGIQPSVASGQRWSEVLQGWQRATPAQDIVVGNLTHPLMQQLLPHAPHIETLFGMSVHQSASMPRRLEGIVISGQ